MATELQPTVDFQAYFNEQTLVYVVFWVAFIMGIVLVFFCVGFLIWYMTYRIKIRYYQIIGKAKDDREILRFIGTDKAKLIKLRGNIYNLRFFWKRRKIEPPSTEAYLSTKKGYEMHVKTDGIDFEPMILRANPGFENVPMHKRLWLVQTQKQALEQYSKPTFWEKYGTLILTIGTILLCLAAMSFTVWYAAKVAERAINAYSPAILEAAKNSRPVAPGS